MLYVVSLVARFKLFVKTWDSPMEEGWVVVIWRPEVNTADETNLYGVDTNRDSA